MPKIRITKRPWEVIEVDDADYLDLKRQGLLVEEQPTPAEDVQPVGQKKSEGAK